MLRSFLTDVEKKRRVDNLSRHFFKRGRLEGKEKSWIFCASFEEDAADISRGPEERQKESFFLLLIRWRRRDQNSPTHLSGGRKRERDGKRKGQQEKKKFLLPKSYVWRNEGRGGERKSWACRIEIRRRRLQPKGGKTSVFARLAF